MAATYLKLIGSMLLWGGTWVAGRYVAPQLPPFPAAFLRFLFAGVFLLFLLGRVQGRITPPTRKEWLPLVLLGLTGIFGYNAFFFSGLQTVAAGRAALIIASIPACMTLVAVIFMGERLTISRLAGIPLSLLGVWAILTEFDPGVLLRGGVGEGEFFLFGCVACWTAYSLLGKKYMAGMSPLFAVAWSCLVGDALLLIPAMVQGLPSLAVDMPLSVWACLAYLGVMATGLAFAWYYEGIKAIGAGRAGVFINLVPVTAIVLGVVLLDERITLSLVVGGAMVIGGVWLTNRPARKNLRTRARI
ncbi:DMT family transporter [Desulfohalovibrio reitneri]|uniref:DMT family transporter n=1 Tax=Desulfohalovibrio reitneri TaxID=1307759 RepID=UPI0004A74F1B|nr:DMT family transporter [Desulfohalovibrio reitneri]